jgi:hypothetical protein
MLSAVTSATHAQPVAPTAGTSSTKSTQSKPQPTKASGGQDTVQLSSAAQAMLAALKESSETPAQTAQEAGSGDPQAQRLLAKQAAAKFYTPKVAGK